MFLKDAAEFLPILLEGLRLTLIVTAGSLVLSTVLGLVWALMRVSGVRALVWISKAVVNLIRGIPIIVQLFYIYFVLPEFGIKLSALQAAILGLGVAYSAYQAENFRAGIEAIDFGQIEAAQSLGMSWAMTMRRVILPQAVRRMLPALTNRAIEIFKMTTLASAIAYVELLQQGRLIASLNFNPIEAYTAVAILFFICLWPLVRLTYALERRLARSD